MKAQKQYPQVMPGNASLYDRDFYAWTKEQAALIRARRFEDADVENIAEEIESMGRGEKRELYSRLTVLIVHLLKWKYQSLLRSKSWQYTIREQRRQVRKHLEDNPSLAAHVDASFLADVYQASRVEAGGQTGMDLSVFPEQLPWQFSYIVDDDAWPD